MNVKDIKKFLIYTMLVVVCLGMYPTVVLADGDGDLNTPSITILPGTKLLAAGTGMVLQPGQIDIDVPLGATVEQVLLYWAGRGDPDDSITVNGTSVPGTLIGSEHTGYYAASGFRANITDLGLVSPGSNTLEITDMDFSTRNDGASVLVIIKDGPAGPYGVIDIRDGMDYAYYDNPPGPLQVTTKETFTFLPEPFTRSADLTLLLGDGTPDRPDRINISIGGTTTSYTNQAVGSDGEEWDTNIYPLVIPAGETEVSVQLFSEDLSPTEDSDSLSWVAAALSIEPLPLASIGDYVWNDTNNNGIQEVGEPGVEDVTVNLMNCSGGQLGQTTTDSNGNYSFDGLTPGDYNIHFVLPNGYSFSPNDTAADYIDSDADPTSGMTICTTLVPGENDMTWDAGIYLLPPPPGTGTPGYWKNHPEAWPVVTIEIGGETYTKAIAIGIMNQPVKGDKTLTMFPHLVSAKLNVLIGNPDSCIADIITAADAWMTIYPPGYGVKGNSNAWDIGEPLSKELDKYNNGELCAPHRD